MGYQKKKRSQQVMKKGKKEAMNLDRSKERQIEGFELMKFKKKFMQLYYTLKKLKEII